MPKSTSIHCGAGTLPASHAVAGSPSKARPTSPVIHRTCEAVADHWLSRSRVSVRLGVAHLERLEEVVQERGLHPVRPASSPPRRARRRRRSSRRRLRRPRRRGHARPSPRAGPGLVEVRGDGGAGGSKVADHGLGGRPDLLRVAGSERGLERLPGRRGRAGVGVADRRDQLGGLGIAGLGQARRPVEPWPLTRLRRRGARFLRRRRADDRRDRRRASVVARGARESMESMESGGSWESTPGMRAHRRCTP